MNFLYPRLRASWLPIMLAHALLGAALAGLYGIVHDQITYTISPEYFARLKFAQFHYADFGLPPRIFVAEIGFLAAWWVGFLAGWFVARITVPAFSPVVALRHSLRALALFSHPHLRHRVSAMGWGCCVVPTPIFPPGSSLPPSTASWICPVS
jgi:hypothetical protein